ncbi:hypothetical protein M885DRAFT_615116 [Pelagophyceae sp. CCMP2097]|nr:hypothetical protein M885DRAFT_615116 [Pelagophyceae sp. CCMP2097]|mmetsp:Transcript_5/g.22  ORF Transcript_5/g.22 Transcript_5/m.22 type:complete len:157 (+) Transcript_5:39-509(+)|eukprot:CAMPEP_0184261810 /NCGR_PEP_ID=MMETSP0977-20130417/15563_1 /TAXON_ID=483370 /ORGANISM="non described non described, Strain CCMP2097" /LENGTH=156 /DNA_ID=CAMNT_0026567487 /DNA_START=41 /DNA_END=511 /DNA_ORIENTATION=+
MAGAAAKKQAKAEAGASQKWWPLLVGANVFFIIVRLLLRRATATRRHWLSLPVTALIYACTFSAAVESVNQPKGGLGQYFFDVLLLTMFTQCAAAFSDKAWWLFGLVPAFCAFKAVEWKLNSKAAPAAAPAAVEEEDDDAPDAKGKKPRMKRGKRA